MIREQKRRNSVSKGSVERGRREEKLGEETQWRDSSLRTGHVAQDTGQAGKLL